jgi:hypothetical protein
MPARVRRPLSQSLAVAGLVWLILLLALFWRLWTPIEGARRTFTWDAIHEYWGDLQFQRDAYADGELPLWNPFDRTGYPFHTDPQAGVLYPVNWALVAGAAAGSGTPYWLVAVKIVFHFWLACTGVWFYLRRRGAHPAACYAAGAVFIVSYPFLHNIFSALNWGVAWAPWLLAAIDAWAARPDRPRGALVALAAAMSCLAGAPASFFYTLLVALPYGAWAAVAAARAAEDRRAFLRDAAVSASAAAGLFLAMTAAQLGWTGSAVEHTVRDARDLTFITEGVLGAKDVAALLMPRMLGENTYVGAAAVMWAALSLSAFATGRRLVLGGVAVAGFALALGKDASFLAASASFLEPFGFFRRAHRYLYAAQLPIAILAAEGLDALVRLDAPALARKILRGVLVWGVVAVAVFGVGFARTQEPNLAAQPLRDAFVLGCLSTAIAAWLTAMILVRAGPWRARFAWIGAAALFLDLWYARVPDLEKGMVPVPSPRRDGEVAGLDGVPLAARIYDRDYLGYRPGIRLQVRDLGGYEGDPLALSRFAALLERVRRAPRDLGHLNVGWLLEADGHGLKKSAADQGELRPVRKGVRRVAHVAPAVLWTARVEVVAGGRAAALAALVGQPVGSAAVLEEESLGAAERAALAGMRAASPPAAVPGRLLALERNALVAEVDAPQPGAVVVHEAYFPGWRAWVDGREARVLPANVGFRALLVGPGRHRIEMRYRPRGALFMALVSLLGLLGAVLTAAIGLRRQARPDPGRRITEDPSPRPESLRPAPPAP